MWVKCAGCNKDIDTYRKQTYTRHNGKIVCNSCKVAIDYGAYMETIGQAIKV